MNEIKICDFTLTPGPRYIKQGSKSAEEFYIKILEPEFTKALLSEDILILNLDNVYGYFPSFFDEIFGRLTQKFGKHNIQKYLKVVSEDDPERINTISNIVNNFEKNGFSNNPANTLPKIYSNLKEDNLNTRSPSILYIFGEILILSLAIISLLISLFNPSDSPTWNIVFCASVILGWCYCAFGINSDFMELDIGHYLAYAGFVLSNILSFLGIILLYCIK